MSILGLFVKSFAFERSNKRVFFRIIPPDLEMQFRTRETNAVVDLHFVDNKTQKYVPPKVSLKAFSGQGHSLG
jgi:hypothetical protein